MTETFDPEKWEREKWEREKYQALQRAVGPYRIRSMDWGEVEPDASKLHWAEQEAVDALQDLANAATDQANEITNPSEVQDERWPFRYRSLADEFERATIAMAKLAELRNHVRPNR